VTLPASGTISANDINVELGRAGTAAFSMNGSEERALAEVASGAISFSNFHGKSAGASTAASLTARTVTNTALFPGSTTCYYKLDNNGSVYGNASLTNYLEVWMDTGTNSEFDVRFDSVSGVTPVATNITFNTWLTGMTVDRYLSLSRTSLGTNEFVVDVSIRDQSTQTVLTTARITMQANVINLE